MRAPRYGDPDPFDQPTNDDVEDDDDRDPLSATGGNSDDPRAMGGFSSPHSGVVNFAFVDGSTRPLTRTVNLSVLQFLANRHDGALIDELDF